MTGVDLAPLFPLGAQQPNALLVQGGEVTSLAPLLWQAWAGVEAQTPKPTVPQPNPAPNRAVKSTTTAGLTQELAALTAMANALQQTSDRVTEAHALFLRNQDAALDQIQQISHLLQAIRNEN